MADRRAARKAAPGEKRTRDMPEATMPFAALMGVEITGQSKARVTGRLTVREDLCTAGHICHGGAYMAFADSLGAIGGFLNLPPGARTTTLESKTNFLGPAPVGSIIIGTATPVHRGRRTQVWQTRITTQAGKLLALVTQTQLVM